MSSLAARAQRAEAQVEISISQERLKKALKIAEEHAQLGDRLNAEIYRALVLNCEALGDKGGMGEYFDMWLTEHPDDPDAHSEWQRLAVKFHLSRPAAAS